ncbi:aminopeptidase N [Amnibacterium kyonggiense]|uniref:Aminopeptidase N n=1 Tax=Amnibacterium kyonggiense TaxID=595671 RepID=A0A4R7FLC1_9MICO|nr:aminopeptidase N [Amnibacterium kyonggiense]TDS77167.1 aminopeptidase N [Amnibacterium kyonggiense]
MSSLTRDEAEARAALLAVDRYDVHVDLTGLLEGDTLRSTSTIAFTATTPGASTFVDVVADVESATLNGRPLDVGTATDGRLPFSDLEADNVLVVSAAQSRTDAGEGVLRTVDTDGLVYVWTTFEPDEARRLWACFDQPDLKAVHRFTVLAPESWTVTNNSAPDAVEPAGDGARRWTFAPTPPLSTYVTVVNAGPFHEVRRRVDGHDLGLYCRRTLASILDRDADELFDLTARGLAWFGERFAFPQERYDQVFVPNMGGAMENWGSVTHTDAFLARSTPSYRERSERANVVLHEMAHMWFGDLVTMRWWDDLWLNEAFASWAAAWAMAGATDFTDAWATELLDAKLMGYRHDMSPATHAIRGDVPDVEQAMANFDAITYDKGEAVLHQLATYVGEDAFVEGLRTYFAEHAWSNTVLDDLMSAFAAASGRDLGRWTSDWLDRAGTDTLVLEGSTLTATAPDGGEPRPHRLRVAGYSATPEALVPVGEVEVELDGAVTEVRLPAGDVHQVNAGDRTFAAVRGPGDPVLRARAGELPDPVARTLAVTTAWDGLVKGELRAGDLLDAVLGLVAAEPSPAVVEALLDRAVQAAELWAPLPDVPGLVARVADSAAALADSPAHRIPALRTLAATATSAAHLALLEAASSDDVDLAWRLLARRAELGQDVDAAAAALEPRDPDPEARFSALAVIASKADAAAKEEAWRALMVDRRVPAGSPRRSVIGRFWRPLQVEVLAPYAGRYLEVLDSFGSAGLLGSLGLVRGMFPYAVLDDDLPARATAAALRTGVSPTVRTALLLGADVGARMLAARRA